MKNKHLIEQLRLEAKEQGKKGLDGQCLQILLDQAADRIEEQASLVRLWSDRADELRLRVDRYYRLYCVLFERTVRYFNHNPHFNYFNQWNKLWRHLYTRRHTSPFVCSRFKPPKNIEAVKVELASIDLPLY